MNTQPIFQKVSPYVAAVLIFLALAFIYCSPVLQNKVIQQGDVIQAMGMQHELNQYHEQTGKYTLWTNSMFGGMPTYQIGKAGIPESNIFAFFARFIRLHLPTYSVDIIFVYLIGFFILLLAFGFNPWLSIAGAIAFAFSSYNFIIIIAGHVNQAFVIALMPAVIAGFILIYRQKYIIGAIVSILSFGVEIYFNHPQMTYYLGLILLVYVIVEFIYAYGEKQLKNFIISTAIVGGSFTLGLIPNITGLITTYEYSKDTTRGKTELTKDQDSRSTGLDKDYALSWSYEKWETFTLLIPNFKGGASGAELSKNSETYSKLISNGVPAENAKDFIKQAPTYWGDQPFTMGPVYIGAVVCFLFVLSLFLVDKKLRWWTLSISIIAIFLSWGKHFEGFTDLFFYYFPMYNKFRSVSSILIIPSILFPLLGFIGIKNILDGGIPKKQLIAALKKSFFIAGGISLFFLILGSSLFDFSAPTDSQLKSSGYPGWLMEAIISDRKSLFIADALRSFIFILASASLIWLIIKDKIKANIFILLLAFLILIDMWPVDKRYMNDNEFMSKKRVQSIQPTNADLQILQDKDPDYRVFNVTANPFTDARTSYFHKSLGGYHGAKLRRYQELIDKQLIHQNMAVIDMLNTKYFITKGENNEPVAQRNPGALGNSWFVENIQVVQNADEELDALTHFDPAKTAVLDKKYLSVLPTLSTLEVSDSTASIKLKKYEPNDLKYKSSSTKDRFAVFSEIYYNDHKGWNGYIDGKKTSHVCVNYVLRGMVVPAGMHEIEFKFEPASFSKGQKISYISSTFTGIVLLLLMVFGIYKKSKSSVSEQK